MIKQTRKQAKDTRTLKHFTRFQYLNSIADIGIQLEGYNEEQYQIGQNGEYICNNPIQKTLGRYVWLTKGHQAETINSVAHNGNDKEILNALQSITAPIFVDDEGLKIISWKLLKRKRQ
ncbi:MAG: hypothetical protein ACI82S_002117 [Patiriisocius sp.]|jgi:hypothetical protein